MKPYDMVMSLGENCLTAISLRELKLCKQSLPFDWSAGVIPEQAGIAGFLGKINLICTFFNNAFEEKDYREYNYAQPGEHRFVRNLRTGLQYIHDFPWEKSIHEYFPEYRNKYERRVKRFYNFIKESNSIIFVFIARSTFLPLEDILEGCKKLEDFFYGKKISFLILQNDEYIDKFSYDIFNLSDSIIYIKYNDFIIDPVRPDLGNFIMVRKILSKFINNAEYFSFLHEDISNIGLSTKKDIIRWSLSKRILLNIQCNYKSDFKIDFNAVPYINEKIRNQPIDILANGRHIANWNFVFGEEMPDTSILINKSLIKNKETLTLEFLIPNAISPHELNISEDVRTVGIGFVDMVIHEME